MKYIFIILSFFLNSLAYANEGYTYTSGIAKSLNLPEHVVTLIIVSLILIVLGLFYRSKLASLKNVVEPDKSISLRNIIESYGEFIYAQCRTVIGDKETPKYFEFIGALFLFILFSNLIGLIPGFMPPTENINTTLALGVASFLYYNYVGCKEQGTLNYLKHFAGPLWYMAVLILPIELISNAVRPLSLAMRLRGNIYGDHLVVGVFSSIFEPYSQYLLPIPFLLLGLLVCFIQAYVFTVLTMVYISLATAHHDHGEEVVH